MSEAETLRDALLEDWSGDWKLTPHTLTKRLDDLIAAAEAPLRTALERLADGWEDEAYAYFERGRINRAMWLRKAREQLLDILPRAALADTTKVPTAETDTSSDEKRA